MESWWITMSISFAALTVAVVLGVSLAVMFASSKWIERSFFPYAVVLQVTPIVAIAPLIIIWVNDVKLSLLICAWIVAFFPILSNTTVGLNSADRNLVDLFRLYRASALADAALSQAARGDALFPGGPAHLGRPVADRRGGGGVRRRHRRHAVGAGLSHPRIGLPAPHPAHVCRLVSDLGVTGVLLFLALSLLSHLCLRRWHESALQQEN